MLAALTSELAMFIISCTGLPSLSSMTLASGAMESFPVFSTLGRPRCKQSTIDLATSSRGDMMVLAGQLLCVLCSG